MTELLIKTADIEHNAAVIKQEIGPAGLIGVVKANGYGMGTVTWARLLKACGVDTLAVAEFADALLLRENGYSGELLLLAPLLAADDVETAINERMILLLTSRESAELAERAADRLGEDATAHLALNSGFGRYGFEDAAEMVAVAQSLRRVRVSGVCSHLSDAAGKKETHTLKQYRKFSAACEALSAAGFSGLTRHLANSTAALRFAYTRLDAVRIGSAFLGRVIGGERLGLRRVGVLRSAISEIYDRPAGTNIGYGNNFRTTRPTRTAVIPAGYFHGFALERGHNSYRTIDTLGYVYHSLRCWLRHSRHQVEIAGENCPVLGAIGLCSLVVDVSSVNCAVGDTVLLAVNPLFVDATVPRLLI